MAREYSIGGIMAKEIEAKILDIEPEKMRKHLLACGARRVSPLTKQKRYVFDIDKNDKSKWIRLRTDGKSTTLTVKIIKNNGIDGTQEFETEVGDIDSTLKILQTMGFTPKSYQENYREMYELDGVAMSIDFWPKIKPYLEMEADTIEKVQSITKKLNTENNEVTSENTKDIYARDGVDLDIINSLTFDEAAEAELLNG